MVNNTNQKRHRLIAFWAIALFLLPAVSLAFAHIAFLPSPPPTLDRVDIVPDQIKLQTSQDEVQEIKPSVGTMRYKAWRAIYSSA